MPCADARSSKDARRKSPGTAAVGLAQLERLDAWRDYVTGLVGGAAVTRGTCLPACRRGPELPDSISVPNKTNQPNPLQITATGIRCFLFLPVLLVNLPPIPTHHPI